MFTKERSFISIEYPCVVIMGHELGHRCGYVEIPTTHPLYGVNYDEATHKLAGYFDMVASQREVTVECLMNNLGPIGLLCMMFSPSKLTPSFVLGVHGGITYSANNEGYPISINGYWWFGYDCGHSGDAKDLTVITNKTIIELEKEYPTGGVLRTTEYCVKECVKLADQLRSVEIEYNRRKEILFRKFMAA